MYLSSRSWVIVVCVCLQEDFGFKLCAFVSRKVLGSSCVLLSPGRFWVKVVCVCLQEGFGLKLCVFVSRKVLG